MKKNQNHPPLLMEALSGWLVHAFQCWKLPLLASFFWGALAYMFAFTNKLINHDEVSQLFGKGATVSSGRWGLGALDLLFPNVSMPWIYGVITVVFIAIAICLILHMFAIHNRVIQVLLAGSIMVFPSLIGVFGYMFTSSSYGLSFLLAVLASWLLTRSGRWAVVPALICMIASLSIYQSYISVAACLLVLALIQMLLKGEDPLKVLKHGFGYVAFLAVSLAGYYAATQLILALKDVSFNEYASDNITFSAASILKGIRLAYLHFFDFFTINLYRLVPTAVSSCFHFLLLASMLVLLLLWAGKQQTFCIPRFLLLGVLIGILPLAINCMYLITGEEAVHTLVLYSFVSLYILSAILADYWIEDTVSAKLPERLRRIVLDVFALALSVIVIINVYVANTAWLNMHLRYENAYAFYSSLTSQIRQMPTFQEGTKVAVVGSWQTPEFYAEHLEFTDTLVGVKGFLPSDYSARYFMEYYIGFPAQFVSDKETEALAQTETYRNMPVYPYYGSIELIDNVIVVKLSP